MKEKEEREEHEKQDNAEQATIWKKEKEEFDAFEKKKQDKIKSAYREFSSQLHTQINSNKNQKHQQKFIMSAEENHMNRQLMEQINNLASQGHGLQ